MKSVCVTSHVINNRILIPVENKGEKKLLKTKVIIFN